MTHQSSIWKKRVVDYRFDFSKPMTCGLTQYYVLSKSELNANAQKIFQAYD
ncbi:hypothetical protein Plhal304r1_c034g0106851 [Plasmopara halstedii]